MRFTKTICGLAPSKPHSYNFQTPTGPWKLQPLSLQLFHVMLQGLHAPPFSHPANVHIQPKNHFRHRPRKVTSLCSYIPEGTPPLRCTCVLQRSTSHHKAVNSSGSCSQTRGRYSKSPSAFQFRNLALKSRDDIFLLPVLSAFQALQALWALEEGEINEQSKEKKREYVQRKIPESEQDTSDEHWK